MSHTAAIDLKADDGPLVQIDPLLTVRSACRMSAIQPIPGCVASANTVGHAAEADILPIRYFFSKSQDGIWSFDVATGS